MRIECAKKNFVAQNRQSAIHAPATGPNIRRQRALILPDGPARTRVQRKSAIILAGAIEDSIHHQRRRFEFSASHRLVSPLGNERRRVRSVDLLQRTVTMSRVIAGIHQPVLRLLRRFQQPPRRHLRADVKRETNRSRKRKKRQPHHNRHSERSEESALDCPGHRLASHCAPTASR